MTGYFGLQEQDLFTDQTHLSWHDPMWLSINPLSEQNCLEYFSNSIFYEKNPQFKYKVIKHTSGDEAGFRIAKIKNIEHYTSRKGKFSSF